MGGQLILLYRMTERQSSESSVNTPLCVTMHLLQETRHITYGKSNCEQDVQAKTDSKVKKPCSILSRALISCL